MSCCPAGSEGSYFDEGYVIKGEKKTTPEGIEFYATGTPNDKGIIVFSDVFGWNSGRIRRFADVVSEKLDAYVCVGRYLTPGVEGGNDGDALPLGFDTTARYEVFKEWIVSNHPWESLKPKFMSVFDHMIASGCKKIGGMGFCWGAWAIAHLSAERKELLCAVVPHPSFQLEGFFNKEVMDLVQQIQCPILLCPAGNDPDRYRSNGDFYECLVKKFPATRTEDFPDVKHGFSLRGDWSDSQVRECTDKVLALTEEYFKANL